MKPGGLRPDAVGLGVGSAESVPLLFDFFDCVTHSLNIGFDLRAVAGRGGLRDALGHLRCFEVAAADAPLNLRDDRRARWISVEQQFFDTAVLVSEHNFEVKYFFAVALEAEMTGLDDAGVHRPHRHFMNFVAIDPIEGIVAGDGSFCMKSTPGSGRAVIRAVIAKGL